MARGAQGLALRDARTGSRVMPDHHADRPTGRRNDRPFRPAIRESGLESRLLLSTGIAPSGLHRSAQVAAMRAQGAYQIGPKLAFPGPQDTRSEVTPTAEINAQFAAFVADFELVEEAYVQAIVSGSTSTITVGATLTAPYTYPSTQMQVDDAAVFGPNGVFTTPVNASASLGVVPVGTTYVLTGRSGNTLIVNTATSSNSNLVQGATLAGSSPEHQPDECRFDLPQLHHQSLSADGHQPGQLLQQPSAPNFPTSTRRPTRRTSGEPSRNTCTTR